MGHDVPVVSRGIWIGKQHGDALGELAGSNEKSSRLTRLWATERDEGDTQTREIVPPRGHGNAPSSQLSEQARGAVHNLSEVHGEDHLDIQ